MPFNGNGGPGTYQAELWVSPLCGIVRRVILHADDNVTLHTDDELTIDLGVQAYPVVKALQSVDSVPVVCNVYPFERYHAVRGAESHR